MRFESFIAVDRADSGHMREGGRYAYTVTGNVIFQIGAVVPLIERGNGCFGVAKVEGFSIKGSTTEVKFQALGEISQEAKKAYYTLYQLNSGVRTEDDAYDSSDQFIPGAMNLGRRNNSRSNNRGNRLNNGLFSEDY